MKKLLIGLAILCAVAVTGSPAMAAKGGKTASTPTFSNITLNQDPEHRARLLAGYRIGDMWAPQLDTVEALRLVAREFIDAITESRPPLTDGFAGYRVVRLLEVAQRSIEEKGREIELASPSSH